MGNVIIPPGIKWMGCETALSLPLTAKAKDEWNNTSISPCSLTEFMGTNTLLHLSGKYHLMGIKTTGNVGFLFIF
jgi:hypothetical protein